MRMLAALMLSMTLLTTGLLAHALVTDDQRPGDRPPALAGRTTADHERRILWRAP
jgi:hypothetical protein